MKRSSSPKIITVPFAKNGQRQELQNSIVPGTSLASYDGGFPPITMISKDAGGIPPQGKDFNQILYELSADAQWSQASGVYPYDSAFSTAIGGYPKGAVVIGTDNQTLYQNTVDDNTVVPGADSTWTVVPNDLSSLLEKSTFEGSDAYSELGGFYSQEAESTTTSPSDGLSNISRRGQRGQFEVVSQPWEKQTYAGITFGGDNNRATIQVDARGSMLTSVWYKGKLIQNNIQTPVLETLGYIAGPDSFQGMMLRMGDPDLTPTIFVEQNTDGTPLLGVMNPHQFGEYGYPNPSDEGYSYNLYYSRKQVQSYVASAITTAVGSYNKYFTYQMPGNDKSSFLWVTLAVFTSSTGTANANGIFKGLISASGNVFYNTRSYMVSGNSKGLSSVTLSSTNVNTYFNALALDAPLSDDSNNTNYITKFGVTQSGNTVTLYARLPYSCAYSTSQALSIGYSSYVSYSPSAFVSTATEPSGIIYLTTLKPYNSSNVTVSSDGTMVAASPIVRISTDENTSDRTDITSGSFVWSGSGTVNTEASKYSVTRKATGTYLIPSSKLSESGWMFKNPKSASGGDDLAIVEASNTDDGVLVTVYERVMTISGSTVSVGKGDLIDVPSDSWVDVRLYQEPTIL